MRAACPDPITSSLVIITCFGFTNLGKLLIFFCVKKTPKHQGRTFNPPVVKSSFLAFSGGFLLMINPSLFIFSISLKHLSRSSFDLKTITA